MSSIPPGAVAYRSAGRTYPYKSSKGCHTCKSPWRGMIETSIVSGMSPARAALEMALVCPVEQRVSAASIRNHLTKGHLPFEEEVRHKIIEERFIELNLDVEGEAANRIDSIAFLRTVINDTAQRVLRREIEPEIPNGMTAVNLLRQMEVVAGPSYEETAKGIGTIMRAVRAVVTGEQYQQISQIISLDPIILGLMGKAIQASSREVAVTSGSVPEEGD